MSRGPATAMVKLKLEYQAELENVDQLEPLSDVYELEIRCGTCREKHPKGVTIDASEQRPQTGSRGNANLVWRCGFCKRESSATFDPGFKRQALTQDNATEHKTSPWACKGHQSGTAFQIDELEDWTDYDEKAGLGVSIFEVKTRISRA